MGLILDPLTRSSHWTLPSDLETERVQSTNKNKDRLLFSLSKCVCSNCLNPFEVLFCMYFLFPVVSVVALCFFMTFLVISMLVSLRPFTKIGFICLCCCRFDFISSTLWTFFNIVSMKCLVIILSSFTGLCDRLLFSVFSWLFLSCLVVVVWISGCTLF